MTETETPSPLTVETPSLETLDYGPQFSQIHPVGYGASGLIVAAYHETRKHSVAIKRLAVSDGKTGQNTLREVRIIGRLKHENVVNILEIIGWNGKNYSNECSLNAADLTHVMLVQELMDTDLHSLILTRQLEADHVVFFTYQLLRGLKYIHSLNVMHRDLRPCNVLVNCQTLVVKLTDFGISRIVDPNYSHKGHLSPNVGSCGYHSPEQLLTPRTYTNALDMWSLGCVLVEMITGAQLFSGTTPLEQLRQIVDVIFLTEQDWSQVLRIMPNKMLKNHPFKPRRPLGTRLGDALPAVVDLAEQLLVFDPHQRISAEDALAHPFVRIYHMPSDEPTALHPLQLEHEVDNLSPTSLRTSVFSECQLDSSAATSSINPQASTDSHTTTMISQHSSPPSATNPRPAATGTRPSLPSSTAFPPSATTLSVVTSNPRSAATSPVSRPSSTTPPPPPPEDTHTLEEILSLQQGPSSSSSSAAHNPSTPPQTIDDDDPSSSSSSYRSGSVEDLNLRNLRHSQENLMSSSSYNILQLGVEEVQELLEEEPTTPTDAKNTKEKHDEKEVDEKDVAELSARKLEEDKELETIIKSYNKLATQSVKSDGVQKPQRQQYKETDKLRVCIDHKKPQQDTLFTYTPPRALSPSCNHCVYISDDEEFKEKKLLEMESASGGGTLSKLNADCLQSEKNDHDLDEMYRLPTEHLRQDNRDNNRDYSNERLKQKHLNKIHVRQLLRYREEINELNERLREEGACGGFEEEMGESEPDDILVGGGSSGGGGGIVLTTAPIPGAVQTAERFTIELNNEQRLLTTAQGAAINDGFSSPEEQPSSPRQPHSGARPKKSPRKQKAL